MELLIIFFAKYLFLIVILTAIGFILHTKKRKQVLLTSSLALPLTLIIGKLLNKLIINPRPFVIENVQPLISHAPNNGFPSDHVLLTATVAALVFTQNRRLGAILFVLSLLVGIARVIAKVHHTSDILGSILIAAAAVYISTITIKLLHPILKNILTKKIKDS